MSGVRLSEKDKISRAKSGIVRGNNMKIIGSNAIKKIALSTLCALNVEASVSYARISKRKLSCTTFSRSSELIGTSLTQQRTKTRSRRTRRFVWKKSTTTNLKSSWARRWCLWHKSSFGKEWQQTTTPRAKTSGCSTHLTSTSRSRIPYISILSLAKEPLRTSLSSTRKSCSSLIKKPGNCSSILTNRTLTKLFTWRLLTCRRATQTNRPKSCRLKNKN